MSDTQAGRDQDEGLSSLPAHLDFHFDPMCPFAYTASLWVRQVRAEVYPVEISWRFFSLEEVNRGEGKKHPWERPWSYGWSLMRIGAYLRRRDMSELDAWYLAIGTALHKEGRKPHDQDVARGILEDLGFGAQILDLAIEDPTTHREVLSDHEKVVSRGGFGVPTLIFPDGQTLFGPVLKHPPEDTERTKRLWEIVTAWREFPEMYEIQRPKAAQDLKSIVDSLQPYLEGRDWESIDRGKVIHFETEAEEET
jgi:2-hydroxychromene-2-carboxylate isomerase